MRRAGGESKSRVEQLEARLRAVTGALRAFAEATTDYEQLLGVVARKMTEVVADGCVVRLLVDGSLAAVAFHLPLESRLGDAESIARVRRLLDAPQRVADYAWGERMMETGEAYLAGRVDLTALTPEIAEAYATAGIHSLLVTVLRVRGESIGTLSLFRFHESSPPFDGRDREMAQALGDHAALAISNSRSLAAERAARESLRSSEAFHRLMFDKSPLPKWLCDAETERFLAVNEAALSLYGYAREELSKLAAADLAAPEDVRALGDASPRRHRRKDGAVILVEVTSHTLTLDGRECRLAVGRDVTERIKLEEQLRQSQKMDAIGRLAGGVAHDFNNILSVTLSCAEFLLEQMVPDDPMRVDVEEIFKASKRAADLTRQLLMFSHQPVVEPRVLDLNDVLAGMEKLLRRVLGADVELVARPAKPLGRVRADPSSVEQLILSLAVNARDAMPTGGRLTIETANVDLDESFAHAHLGVKPGPHVLLAVTDTGCGIEQALLSRIFEPFFNTKESGKGTGLGLSTVFGIAQQSSGTVWVSSEPGRGTTFNVYLPCLDARVEAQASSSGPPSLAMGSETILLVEDDDQVRVVARGILARNGYHVLEANSAGEALLLAERHARAIHLLLTDVVMPHMSGPELAKRLCRARPQMRLLCMSGYTDDSIVRHGVLEARIPYLQKPITPDTLAAKVREVLDAPPGVRRSRGVARARAR